MIKYIKHKKIDKEKWDICIAKSLNGSFYAFSYVLDITSPNWDALIEDDYIAVFPLPWRKKGGIKYIYPPFFSTQLGLFSQKKLSIDNFLQAIPKKFKFIEIKINSYNQLTNKSIISKTNRTYLLDLISSYDYLQSNYSENHKRNLKKIQKTNFIIAKNSNPETIIKLFRENNKAKDIAFVESDYIRLTQLMYKLLQINIAEVWSVYDETNTLCAGAFFIKSLNRSTFLFSGSNNNARQNGSMFYLIDKYIQENSNHSTILDFGGSNNINLARFYSGFGAKESNYQTVTINKLSFITFFIMKIVKLIKKK